MTCRLVVMQVQRPPYLLGELRDENQVLNQVVACLFHGNRTGVVVFEWCCNQGTTLAELLNCIMVSLGGAK